MKTTKILGLGIATLTALVLVSPVKADRLTSVKMVTSDATSHAAATYDYFMTIPKTTAIKEIRLDYCTRPSTDTAGTVVGGCTAPDMTTTGADTGAGSGWVTLTQADWTAAQGDAFVTLTNTGTYTPAGANTQVQFEIGGMVNPYVNSGTGSKNCIQYKDGSNNVISSTCFVRLTTYSDTGTTVIDTGIVSYTVVNAVTVSATVDPTFTFVVTGVNSGTNTTGAISTSVTSAYNTLPFGNLTAGTPKYAAHQLFVTTNTKNGYSVTARLTHEIDGVYGGNKIDPFTGVWTTGGAAWTIPSGGTPNTNTGWFGANTTDTNIAGGSPTVNNFGGIGTVTAVTVKDETASDNGLSGTYVTYAIEANVFQPADTYTGALVYDALPTY